MGRTAKFSEELLLEAVIKYSEAVKTKIKASELARWARNNIEGLEEVKDYHFTRPVKNLTTGKLEKRLSTKRIEELNVARDIRKRENENILLSAVNLDRFFELDERSQRKAIQEAREIISDYRRSDIYLRKQNDYFRSLITGIDNKMNQYASEIKEIRKKQNSLGKKVSDLRRNMNDEQIRKKLEEIGITDGEFDLVKYNESLREGVNNIFNIENEIKQYQRNLDVEGNGEEEQKDTSLKENMIDKLMDF